MLLPDELRILTEDELRERWRVSCDELQKHPPSVLRADVLAERQRLLDEIERRNPAAFSAWLTSDAPISSLPQLTGPRTGQRSIAWDALLQRKR